MVVLVELTTLIVRAFIIHIMLLMPMAFTIHIPTGVSIPTIDIIDTIVTIINILIA
jgi:hypothetical protein